MPVADVKAVLTASDASARNALITAHLGKLETELAQTRDAVDSLRKLLQHPENATGIQRRSVPETTAAAVGQVVDRADVFAWWEGALGELHATVRAQGLAVTGPAGTLFASELFQHDRGEVTVFIPADRAVRAIGRVVPAVIPGADLAVITHCGALSGADISYGTLGAYAMAHEISVDGPVREYYLRGPHDFRSPARRRAHRLGPRRPAQPGIGVAAGRGGAPGGCRRALPVRLSGRIRGQRRRGRAGLIRMGHASLGQPQLRHRP
jgi:effector-binding domain-containing protein